MMVGLLIGQAGLKVQLTEMNIRMVVHVDHGNQFVNALCFSMAT